MNPEKYVPIDIKTLAYRYSPFVGKVIPPFLYKKFENILHLDDLNDFFERTYEYSSQDFLKAVQNKLDIKVEFKNWERIEKLEGKSPIFVSNHPVGGPEAMALMSNLISIFPEIKLMAQSFLSIVKPLRTCTVFNKKELKTSLTAIKNGMPMLIYPAGRNSQKMSFNSVFDFEWKQTFVSLARRYDMPIVPIYTSGRMSNRQYRWFKFRKTMHIKLPFESLFLVDEMYKQMGNTLEMIVGTPINPEVFSTNYTAFEWAQRVRQYVFKLKDNSLESFQSDEKATLPLL